MPIHAEHPLDAPCQAVSDQPRAARRAGGHPGALGLRSGRPPADRPDEAGVWLLRLLLLDASWKAASGASGTSPRTAERRVHDLMAMARATSRAQLGWYARFHGWL